jgi:hypothetical protein
MPLTVLGPGAKTWVSPPSTKPSSTARTSISTGSSQSAGPKATRRFPVATPSTISSLTRGSALEIATWISSCRIPPVRVVFVISGVTVTVTEPAGSPVRTSS